MLDPARRDRLERIKTALLDADRAYRRAHAARSAGDYPTAWRHTELADRLAHEAATLTQKNMRAATKA